MSRFSTLIVAAILLSILTFLRNSIWESELALWGDTLKKTQTKARIYRVFADALRKVKRLEEAKVNYEKSYALQPNSPITVNNLGVVYEDMGFLDRAMALYRKANELSPDYPDALNNIGNIAMKRKNLDEAIHYFSLAAKVKVNPEYYYNLGTAYLGKDRVDDAMIWIKKAIALRDDLPYAHTNLGIVYYLKDSPQEAVAELKRALEINPDHVEAHVNLGIIYHYVLKDDRTALQHLKRSLEIAPNLPQADLVRNIIREIEK
jgi:tetratricopeptide (TPR) repeat protein